MCLSDERWREADSGRERSMAEIARLFARYRRVARGETAPEPRVVATTPQPPTRRDETPVGAGVD